MDTHGLSLAYEDTPGGMHVEGNVLYMAGTRIGTRAFWRDALDDLKLPLRGIIPGTGARATRRYAELDAKLQTHPEVDTLVGHSLSGSVIRAYAADHPRYEHRVYAVPGVTWRSDAHSFRHYADPISFFDRGATATSPGWNPHSYVT